MSKTLQIISDVHTEFISSQHKRENKFRALLDKADITVLAGDIVNKAKDLQQFLLIAKEFSTYVVFVPGNHEYYKQSTDSEYKEVCDSVENVFFLQRDRIQVGDHWFSGCTLWTNIDNYASQMMNDPFDASEVKAMHEGDVNWLAENAQKGDIVVTHHLPSLELIHPKYKCSSINSGFATDLNWLIDKIDPLLWICGHTHSPFDVVVGKTRVIINPVGYPGENQNFHKKIIDI